MFVLGNLYQCIPRFENHESNSLEARDSDSDDVHKLSSQLIFISTKTIHTASLRLKPEDFKLERKSDESEDIVQFITLHASFSYYDLHKLLNFPAPDGNF